VDYEGYFKQRLDASRAEGRYRIFADLEWRCGPLSARLFRRELLVESLNPRPKLTVPNDFLQQEAMTSFPLGAIPATSRPVAGVTIPDSKLAREVTELVKNTESPLLFHHSSRVYYWGALTGKRRGLRFDPELLYAGAMFHDMGLTPQYASADKRFEVDGANTARDFCGAMASTSKTSPPRRVCSRANSRSLARSASVANRSL